MYQIFFFFLFVILAGIFGCNPGTGVRVVEEAFPKLSDYRLFRGPLSHMEPNEGVLPYELINPLFSDYAHKARFVWMPRGKSAQYKEDGVLDFPEGTVLVKSFYYQNDERANEKERRIIETRLLVHRTTGWEALNYVWNDEQTEAYYDVVGDIKEISWIDADGSKRNVDYIIPNKNQCKGCHYDKGELVPIGPKVPNLNKSFAYEEGPMNQLEKWSGYGYLADFEDTSGTPQWAEWDDPSSGDLHARATAYLDVNCGHCHNPNGPANTSGLTLLANQPLSAKLGLWKETVAAGAGTGGLDFNIVPGKPEKSILVYRMATTDPAAMMPELGRRIVHAEGLSLIEEWIAALSPAEREPAGDL